MSVKGKIYGKYLKRAKYVVRGKKLKSPIATIQKREVVIKPKSEFEFIEEPVSNQSLATVATSSQISTTKSHMEGKKENDTSFSELGQKIIEGEDNSKSSNNDSRTLLFVIVSLAIIIIAGMVKVGSMVYSEMTPKSNVATTKEKKDKNDELSNFLLSDNDKSDEDVTDEVKATVEPTIEPEITDEEKKEDDEDKEDKKEKTSLADDDKNKDTTSNSKNKRDDFVNTNDVLDYLNKTSSTIKPTKSPTTPTTQPKPPITAGDNTSSKYIEIGRVPTACDIYHVSTPSVYYSAIKNHKYSKHKIEGGKVKVPKSDLNGIWFYNDGSGYHIIRACENGVRMYVNLVTLYEKQEGNYNETQTIYVITDNYIDLEDEYSTEIDAEEGEKRFFVDYNLTLYKI